MLRFTSLPAINRIRPIWLRPNGKYTILTQKRLYPQILASQQELDALTSVQQAMKNDTSPYIDYDELKPSRRWWFRRLTSATFMVSSSIVFSSIFLAPGTISFISSQSGGAHVDLGILALIGAIGVMTGSEATKLLSDQGVMISIPVQCAFATLLGLPVYGVVQNFPATGPRILLLSSLCFALAVTVVFLGPPTLRQYKDKNPLYILAPPIMAMAVAALTYPAELSSPFEFFLYPIFFYGTWMAFQRNLKLSKWNPDLENLDKRIPSAVGINLAFPLLLATTLVVLSYLTTPPTIGDKDRELVPADEILVDTKLAKRLSKENTIESEKVEL